MFAGIVAPMLLGIFNFHSGFDRLFAARMSQGLLTSVLRSNFRWNLSVRGKFFDVPRSYRIILSWFVRVVFDRLESSFINSCLTVGSLTNHMTFWR